MAINLAFGFMATGINNAAHIGDADGRITGTDLVCWAALRREHSGKTCRLSHGECIVLFSLSILSQFVGAYFRTVATHSDAMKSQLNL